MIKFNGSEMSESLLFINNMAISDEELKSHISNVIKHIKKQSRDIAELKLNMFIYAKECISDCVEINNCEDGVLYFKNATESFK